MNPIENGPVARREVLRTRFDRSLLPLVLALGLVAGTVACGAPEAPARPSVPIAPANAATLIEWPPVPIAVSWVGELAFQPGGALLGVADENGGFQLIDPYTGEGAGGGGGLRGLGFSPDGSLAATAGFRSVSLWSTTDEGGGRASEYRGHQDWANDVAFSPDGAWVASVGGGHLEKYDRHIWDSATRDKRWSTTSKHALRTVAWSPDGSLLVDGDTSGAIHLWNVSGETPTAAEPPTIDAHDTVLTDLAFHPDGLLLASSSGNGDVALWSMPSGEQAALFSDPDAQWAEDLTWSPDGALLAVADRDGSIRVWDPNAPDAPLATIALGGGDVRATGGGVLRATAVEWAPDGTWIAAGSSDGATRMVALPQE